MDRDVVVAGGGLAGLVAAHAALDQGLSVLLLEKGPRERLGGLARDSFGGVMIAGSPQQRRAGIPDSAELAYRDWLTFGELGEGTGPETELPRRWARRYCEESASTIQGYLDRCGVRFLPVVNWAERGLFRAGNSVPRWHIAWGTGREIVLKVLAALDAHPRRSMLEIRCDTGVDELEWENGEVKGVRATVQADGPGGKKGQEQRVRAGATVLASGGICGGDLSTVRMHWDRKSWGEPPAHLLNGSSPFADGMLHQKAQALGARLTHMEKHWHYAAGIHDRSSRVPDAGLSLVPPRSALWLDANGRRIGPVPLMGYTDTRFLVEQIVKRPGQYSWQVMNWKIAIKELAVSGSGHMTAFVEKKRALLLRHLLLGNPELIRRLIRECPEDFVVAETLPELIQGMNERGLEGRRIDAVGMEADLREYDSQIERGEKFHTDDQLRRIASFRKYSGDRMRVCKFQGILDPKARPLIAIREFILTRKSLGGLQTDLSCRVLRDPDGAPVPGLYAVGETAGFGGGGSHGLRALEGTFLGGCVLTGRALGLALGGNGQN